MGGLFSKKAFHGVQTFLDKLMEGCFTWGGLMMALCKGGVSKIYFSVI